MAISMHDNTIISYIEYGVLFIIIVIVFNKLVDSFFAAKIEKTLEKKELSLVIEEAQKVDKTTEVESPPLPQYDVYHPSIFLKTRTRNFYFDLIFSKEFFLDEPWLSTLAETLSLLELATDAKVVKQDEKSIELIIGTKGINELKIGQVFNAYSLYDLTMTLAENYATYASYKKQDFREMILAILLLYIDQIDNIRHWGDCAENTLESLVEHMTKELPDENKILILHLINEIHNSVNEMGMIEELQCQINMIQNDLEQTIKVVQSDKKISTWHKSYPRKKMQKRLYSMDEIRRF
ncbi:MAG: hypothetical protein PHW18_05980 [Sulfuricurvum sp.]|uniref:hypothetical protein n=1 Tax=Sulfuricurvum sp. TaxID=2025608 RepID=UPI002639D233|nr:hypothetical protein [Sulfuricurvum sp.]MDD2829106.1 hypothetical protein [Sulfuricurvum sp.]MDD4948854.1 hypothetical protein [Sulfuricurvum sp.]